MICLGKRIQIHKYKIGNACWEKKMGINDYNALLLQTKEM